MIVVYRRMHGMKERNVSKSIFITSSNFSCAPACLEAIKLCLS